MSVIEIGMFGKLLFSTALSVRITDINYGAHLGHDALIGLLHESRCLYFQSKNVTELNFDGLSIVVAKLAVIYKSEAFHGDILTVNIYAGDKSPMKFELVYEVKNKNTEKLTAIASTTLAFFDKALKKPVKAPAIIEDFLA